jgi:oxepin-CoA hydrolase/3-oxo-5,6-dehydrosuberyl-CoA semialdehyde dehydrogenase
MTLTLTSYLAGSWTAGTGAPRDLHNATTEEVMATCASGGIDAKGAVEHARRVGGPALRALSFAERGARLKALSAALYEKRDELLDLSIANAGTTRGDAKFDVDGATGTLAAYAQIGAGLGDRPFLVDGEGVQLGRTARFWGQHVFVPRHGVAVHVNAFNFPAWNMMEKAACALLAGVPVIEKPGTPTALLAWRIARIVVESGILPEGAFQFIAGGVGDLLDHLGPQDALAFTGSSGTAQRLRGHPVVVRQNVQVNIEADSLNAAVLAPDADEGSDAYKLFVQNVVLDVRQKTGQKCTAVRRVLVPRPRLAAVRDDLLARIAEIVTGDPAARETTMGPLASRQQREDVRAGIARLAAATRTLCGGPEPVRDRGWFVAPTLFEAEDAEVEVVHRDEVFGPVATLVPYSGDADEAAAIVARGDGSLVGSLYSNDTGWIERAVLGMAPWHGRLWVGSDKVAEQSLPPGMVLPASVHGGPGRAGGGEELGGLRGLRLYLQRTAIQGFKGHVAPLFGAPEAANAPA